MRCAPTDGSVRKDFIDVCAGVVCVVSVVLQVCRVAGLLCRVVGVLCCVVCVLCRVCHLSPLFVLTFLERHIKNNTVCFAVFNSFWMPE